MKALREMGAILSILVLSMMAGIWSHTAQAIVPIELISQTQPMPILNAEVFEDPEHSVDWDLLKNLDQLGKVPWKPTSQFNYGYTRSRYWFKFTVRNVDQTNVRWALELGYPLIQKVGVYIVGASGVEPRFETGRFVPFQMRGLEHRTFLFPFQLEQGGLSVIYTKIETSGTLRAPFRIHSDQSLVPAVEQQSLGLGIYYGSIAALVFYNLFIYFALRDRAYLYYVLYASSFAVLQGSLSGHAYQYLWPQLVFWNQISVPFLVGFSFFFLAIFTRELLDTRRVTPRSNYLLTVLAVLSVSLMVLSVGGYGIAPNKFASVMVSYAPLLVIPAVLLCIRNGSKPAVYYAVAFVSFFIGSAAVASKDLGLLPINFMTLYGMHLGSAIEALLFSLALAYRVRVLREEKLLTELQVAATRQQLAESEFQLGNQRALSQFASQVAHDIRSPLAALNVLEGELFSLPEEKRVMVRSAVNRIRDIANHLLEKNREANNAVTAVQALVECRSVQLISGLLDELITEKRIQFRSKIGIEIEGQLTPSSYGLFALVQPGELKRVISNLINNSVEALGDTGVVTVRLTGDDERICIEVRDNGVGIPDTVLPELMQRGETHGKEGGFGLGLYHAKTILESWDGSFSISSSVGIGTAAMMIFPRVAAPEWFVPSIELMAGDTVVVLDDDSSIHQVWQSRLNPSNVEPPISMIHFSTPRELEDWVTHSAVLHKTALYLCDYELLGEEKNGLDLIETLNIQKTAILVTSRYEEPKVRGRCEKLNVRLIPKGMAGFVPILIKALKRRADAILLDDDVLVHMIWSGTARQNQRKLLSFYEPEDFFGALTEVDTDTPVYIDSKLSEGVKGQDLVPRVKSLGFKRVYLATGYEPQQLAGIEGLTGIVGKDPAPELCTAG